MNFATGPVFVPPELCDRMIDFLWDDLLALRACGLTCRLWLSSSRYHLFYPKSVKLHNLRDWELFEAILHGSVQASTQLPHYIRNLSMIVFNNFDGSKVESTGLAPGVRSNTALLQLMEDFSAVQQLSVTGYTVSNVEKPADNHLQLVKFLCESAFMRSLTKLELCSVAFETHGDLVRVLSACPPLSSLVLKGCRIERELSPLLLPLPASPGNRRRVRLGGDLSIGVYFSSLLSSWNAPLCLLQESIYELCPRRLTWDGLVTASEQPLLRDLLQRTASSLEHVDLTLGLRSGEPIRDELVDLSACNGIISVHVQCDYLVSNARAWVHAVLKHVRSTRLQELHIGIKPWAFGADVMNSECWQWAQVDEDLCRLGNLNPRMTVYFDYSSVDLGIRHLMVEMVRDLEGHLPLARKAHLRMVARAQVFLCDRVTVYWHGEQHWLRPLAED
ncbi:hypothetical protein B0H21DRAFT_88335 [Amylocystis lapponica]|nr:hypothetical protein B0H21DRAFT_88335 [Amylocystis lapponica]